MEYNIIEDIKKLCVCVGQSIDLIARKYHVPQTAVAKMFMETMKKDFKQSLNFCIDKCIYK